MNRKEQKKRTGGTEMSGKDQESRAAKIGKWKSALTFTFTQSNVWAFPLSGECATLIWGEVNEMVSFFTAWIHPPRTEEFTL